MLIFCLEKVRRSEWLEWIFSLEIEECTPDALRCQREAYLLKWIGTFTHMESKFVLSVSEALTLAFSSGIVSAVVPRENATTFHSFRVRSHFKKFRERLLIIDEALYTQKKVGCCSKNRRAAASCYNIMNIQKFIQPVNAYLAM